MREGRRIHGLASGVDASPVVTSSEREAGTGPAGDPRA